jgi:hypothetical protein
MTIKEIEKGALKLNPLAKIHLIDKLLISLDKPNPEIEKIGIQEAEDRVNEYERGKLKVVSYGTVKRSVKRRLINIENQVII